MLKKSRYYVGISMTVQAISFLIMSIFLIAKHKSIAMAFMAVAAMNGSTGAYLLYQCKEEEKASKRGRCFYEENGLRTDRDFSDEEPDDIPVDEEASEEDFQ